MKDNLICFLETRATTSNKMGDDFQKKWKTTSTKMEDDLNFFEDNLKQNGRQPKKREEKNGRQPKKI
jgi:hypothetical protein